MSVSSGVTEVGKRGAQAALDYYINQLYNMDYKDLQKVKWDLYIKEVERLGSVAKFKEKYPDFKIPPPPMQMAGGGVPGVPGLPDIPILVPTTSADLDVTQEERKEEVDDIERVVRESNLHLDLEEFLRPDFPSEQGGGAEPPKQRGKKVFANTVSQLIYKLTTDKRNKILLTDANRAQILKAFGYNTSLQNALQKIFKDNGFDLSSDTTGQAATVSDIVADQIVNMNPTAQQILMNDIAKILNENISTPGVVFKTRDMAPAEPPKIQEPDPEQQEKTRQKVMRELKQIMSDEQAENLYNQIIIKVNQIRLAKYAQTADWSGSDDETNKVIIKIVQEEIKRLKMPTISTSKIFKILKDNITVLNMIPDSTIDQFPDLKIPSKTTEEQDIPTEAEARQILRDAGIEITSPSQIAGFGSYTINTSNALAAKLARQNIVGLDFRDVPFDDDDPDDFDPNRIETIEIRDRRGRVSIVRGNYKKILAILIALGVISEGVNVSTRSPDSSPELPSSEGGKEDNNIKKPEEDIPEDIPEDNMDIPKKDKIKIINDEIEFLQDRIDAAEKEGATQEVIEELERELSAKRQSYFVAYGELAGHSQELSLARFKASEAYRNLKESDKLLSQGKQRGWNKDYLAELQKERDANKQIYDIAVNEVNRLSIRPSQDTSTGEDDKPVTPPDLPSDEGDDPDAEITPPTNPSALPIEPTDTSEGVRIAGFIDPAEVKLFVSTDAEARQEQKRWEEFSRVLPGFGLGGPRVNPLAAVNAEYYKKQFQNPNQTRKLAKPSIWKKPRGTIYNQPQLINIYDGYEKGKVQFENDDYHSNKFMSGTLYNPFRQSVSNWNWNNANMNWHPEHKLAQYQFEPTNIPEVRTQPGFEGIPWAYVPSAQNNNLVGPSKTGVRDAPTYRNDNFSDRPKKVNSNIANFKQNLRVKSTRNR